MGGLNQPNESMPDCCTEEKLKLVSCVEKFHGDSGSWKSLPIAAIGEVPLGVFEYASAAKSDAIYYFGGFCGHDACYHNSLYALQLNTNPFQWAKLSPTTPKPGIPMKKSGCGMVSFKDGEEEMLYVVGGYGPSYPRLSAAWSSV